MRLATVTFFFPFSRILMKKGEKTDSIIRNGFVRALKRFRFVILMKWHISSILTAIDTLQNINTHKNTRENNERTLCEILFRKMISGHKFLYIFLGGLNQQLCLLCFVVFESIAMRDVGCFYVFYSFFCSFRRISQRDPFE